MQKVNWGQVFFLSVIILLASLSRLIPHLDNFTPVIAISIFAGVIFKRPLLALTIPMFALLLSDSQLGFYQGWELIYVCHMTVLIFAFMYSKFFSQKIQKVLLVFFGPLVFFLTSNAVVWKTSGMYSMDLSGLWQSYLAGLPFFKSTLISTAIFSAILFGVFELYVKFIKAENIKV